MAQVVSANAGKNEHLGNLPLGMTVLNGGSRVFKGKGVGVADAIICLI